MSSQAGVGVLLRGAAVPLCCEALRRVSPRVGTGLGTGWLARSFALDGYFFSAGFCGLPLRAFPQLCR
jgi:hypothetical protein